MKSYLRRIEPDEAWFMVRSIVEGDFVKIRARNVRRREAKRVDDALDLIRANLRSDNKFGLTADDIAAMAQGAVFLSTSSGHVGAYSSADPSLPLIFLNNHLFEQDEQEFAITVLHEIVHLFEVAAGIDDPDRAGDTRREAVHDLLCYHALGLGLPRDHWAIKKYPDLLKIPNSKISSGRDCSLVLSENDPPLPPR